MLRPLEIDRTPRSRTSRRWTTAIVLEHSQNKVPRRKKSNDATMEAHTRQLTVRCTTSVLHELGESAACGASTTSAPAPHQPRVAHSSMHTCVHVPGIQHERAARRKALCTSALEPACPAALTGVAENVTTII